MDVLYQCSDKYAPYCGISVTSLFENNKNAENINVFILDDCISEINKSKFKLLEEKYKRNICFISTEPIVEKLKQLGIPSYRGSYTTYLKMFAEEYIPDYVERLLYIDSDTIVNGNLEELFAINMFDKPLAMAYDSLVTSYKETVGIKNESAYYNAGVILFNISNWKKQLRSNQIVNHTTNKRAHYAAADQDLINVVIGKDILPISAKYNFEPAYQMFSIDKYLKVFNNPVFYTEEQLIEAKKDVRIYHFFRVMGEFPWHKNNLHPFNDVFDKYLHISPWYDYEKALSNSPMIFKCEKVAYKVLPEGLFIRLFRLSHELFMRKSNKLSLSSKTSKIM
ncbi:MAG: glycosyltransferase family 8 protein [Eubacterium sp.]|nr:glycosyltransferase family 8 protein [Eubacterium sp.]